MTDNSTEDLEPSTLDNYKEILSCDVPKYPETRELIFPQDLHEELRIINDTKRKAVNRTKSLEKVEEWLVDHGSCSQLNPSIVDNLQERMFDIDPKQIQEYLDGLGTLNAYIHANLACLVNAIYRHYKPNSPFDSLIRERIKNWLPYLKLIGGKSLNGYAFQTSFNSYDTQLFVLKVPQDLDDDTLIHEATIGLYVTNKMRHLLPNFMYVYGYTRCAPPILDDDGNLLTWCTSNQPDSSYLITEKIINGQSFKDFFDNTDLKFIDFQLIFLQLLNALNQGFKRYKFTHNDLHHNNVIIRKFQSKVAVPYYDASSNVTGYIASKYIPVIIDYGTSGSQIGNQLIGIFGLAKSGISPTRPFPMYDIYKLLCFLYEKLSTSKNAKSNEGSVIRTFLSQAFDVFGDGPINERVLRRVSNADEDRYEAPSYLRKMAYDDYIKLSQHLFASNLIISAKEPTPVNIYLPWYNAKYEVCDFHEKFNKGSKDLTAFEYCQTITTLKNNITLDDNYCSEAKQWLDSKFNAESYFITIQVKIQQDINDCQVIIDFLHNNIIEIPTKQNITTEAYIISSLNRVTLLLRLYEKITTLTSMIRASSCALTEQQSYDKYNLQIEQLLNTIQEWTNIFEQSQQLVKQQLSMLYNMILDHTMDEIWLGNFGPLATKVIEMSINDLHIF